MRFCVRSAKTATAHLDGASTNGSPRNRHGCLVISLQRARRSQTLRASPFRQPSRNQLSDAGRIVSRRYCRGLGARRRDHLESRLQRYVIEPSSDGLSLHWAEAMDSARRNGRAIAAADAWVAATALHLGVPLITHNKNHFVGVDGLTVISESGS